MLANYTYKLLSVILILFSVEYQSQDYSFFPETIRQTAEYYNKGEEINAMEYNIKALKKYQTLKRKDEVANIYINIGLLLFSYNKLSESIDYLDMAKKEIGNDEIPLTNARLYSEYAKNYTRLGLYSNSNSSFEKAIYYANRIPNQKQKQYLLFYCYIWKRLNFLNKQDSLRAIEKKALKIMPSAITYTKIADRLIGNKKLDSALYFLNKALNAPDNKASGIKGMTLFSFGNLYTSKNDHKKALHYYLKSLQLFQQAKLKTSIRKNYDTLSSTYKAIEDVGMSNFYLEKFKSINDSIKNEEKNAINIVFEKLTLDNIQEKKNEKKAMYFIIITIVILSVAIIFILRRNHLAKQLAKERLLEKETLKSQKLEQKVNDSFDKLAEMAKDDDPFFLIQFKEIYPEFYENLISYNPNLTDNDIKFCAYIRLNLSTKEIAMFRRLTFRSVETTKYRLKKKLELQAETDLNKWIHQL